MGRKQRQVTRFADQFFEGAHSPNSLIIIPAGAAGFFGWTTLDTCYNLIVEPAFLRQTALEICETNPAKVELLPNAMTHDDAIRDITQLLKREITNDNLGGKLYAESLASALSIHLLREHCAFAIKPVEYKGGMAKHKLRRTLDFINDNLAENVSLKDLSEAAGINQFHLARAFKQATGFAPHQYVICQRIERAKTLLKTTELSIIEICFRAGFNSQSHFTRLFRQSTGATPKAYRSSL